MDFHYEENLQKNPFFVKVVNDHSALISEAEISNWILLIPQISQISDVCLKSSEFLLAHVLTPSEDLPKTHFTSLIGDDIVISEGTIRFKDEKRNFSENHNILFEESYYTREKQKIRIMCIDFPLCREFVRLKNSASPLKYVNSLAESSEFLRYNSTGGNLRKMNYAISNFVARSKKVSDYGKLKTNIKSLFDFCVNTICIKNKKHYEFSSINYKMAIEFCLMDPVYELLFDLVCLERAEESQTFHKVMGKLQHVTVDDLNIEEIDAELLKCMKIEVEKVNSCRSSIGKLNCMKNILDTISTKYGKKVMTIDELLPILVYLLLKSNFYHWVPTLFFIQEFNLSQILNSDNHSSHISYVLATFEAAIYFIQTNENLNLKSHQIFEALPLEDVKSSDEYLHYLFNCVKDDNQNEIMQLIYIDYEKYKNRLTFRSTESHQSSSCHPLCTCSRCKSCELPLNIHLKSTEKQLTMLHVSAIYNVPRMVTILLNFEANVNARDYKAWIPLHYAASLGHQKVLFLLLHGKSGVNAITGDSKTALILASMNGHDCCVKALLYFAEHSNIFIDLNIQDINGNTALHYASLSGFGEIVGGLLEYRAKASIKNNSGKTPSDLAYNSSLKHKLEEAVKYQFEVHSENENDFVIITNEDLADN